MEWRSGKAVVIARRRKRRREAAGLLEEPRARHPHGTVRVAWDNAGTHGDGEVEAAPRAAPPPRLQPWPNLAEMPWRRCRREAAHCGLFGSIDALLGATREFFDRVNRTPERTRSIIGAHPAGVLPVLL